MATPHARQAPTGKIPQAQQPQPTLPQGQPQQQQPQQQPTQERPKQETSRKIDLEYPVTFAGVHYDRLTVRRLKAKDFRQLDAIAQGGNAAAIAMSALICGVDEAVIDELDAIDYLKVQEVIADFFPQAMVAKLQAKASA